MDGYCNFPVEISPWTDCEINMELSDWVTRPDPVSVPLPCHNIFLSDHTTTVPHHTTTLPHLI